MVVSKMPAYKLASVRAYALMHTHTHIFTLYLVRLELLQEERGRVWGHVVDSDERFYLLVFVESPEIFILCGKGGRFFPRGFRACCISCARQPHPLLVFLLFTTIMSGCAVKRCDRC